MFRLALAAAAVAAGLSGSAGATTIDTFDFSQGGFVTGDPGAAATLSGSFTGTVESSGFIELADLTNFRVTFTDGPAMSFGYGASFFSFDPASASSLDFEAGIGLFGTACTGAAAAFGYDRCATGGFPGPVNGFSLGSYTAQLASVTLVSSVLQPPPQPLPQPTPFPVPTPQPTPVPEPGSWPLLGIALLVLVIITRRSSALRAAGRFRS